MPLLLPRPSVSPPPLLVLPRELQSITVAAAAMKNQALHRQALHRQALHRQALQRRALQRRALQRQSPTPSRQSPTPSLQRQGGAFKIPPERRIGVSVELTTTCLAERATSLCSASTATTTAAVARPWTPAATTTSGTSPQQWHSFGAGKAWMGLFLETIHFEHFETLELSILKL